MSPSEQIVVPKLRAPLRLTLSDPARPHPLDGGWWPQSRSLAIEMADLVNNFPKDRPRIVRALYSPPDWGDSPKRVPTARGYIETGSFPRDDTHVMVLTTSERQKLCLLVIPSSMTPAQGEAALKAAVTPYFASSPAKLLSTIIEQSEEEPDPRDVWKDDGEQFWGEGAPPSKRSTS
jgi:hypothetical protein